MYQRTAKRPLGYNAYFANENASRPQVPDTVSREQAAEEVITPAVNSMTTAPFPITMADLERGRDRFNIYCSPCHGVLGDGNGMVAMRGFPHPPDYHSDRLLRAPIGHFVYVITNGYGVMFSYADRVSPHDRWDIAAYIRALQIAGYYGGALSSRAPQSARDLLRQSRGDSSPSARLGMTSAGRTR